MPKRFVSSLTALTWSKRRCVATMTDAFLLPIALSILSGSSSWVDNYAGIATAYKVAVCLES
ncbi:hypothetical protein [Vulcanisaeta moutnovskia]|uniref:hypothetical protein n=1 Tax=Vulcanisaeta moutnovskia TaxID=985052 RepID=UPI001872B4E2|nr:hypothetical protein [Vulcanisaeta moutnovskia]